MSDMPPVNFDIRSDEEIFAQVASFYAREPGSYKRPGHIKVVVSKLLRAPEAISTAPVIDADGHIQPIQADEHYYYPDPDPSKPQGSLVKVDLLAKYKDLAGTARILKKKASDVNTVEEWETKMREIQGAQVDGPDEKGLKKDGDDEDKGTGGGPSKNLAPPSPQKPAKASRKTAAQRPSLGEIQEGEEEEEEDCVESGIVERKHSAIGRKGRGQKNKHVATANTVDGEPTKSKDTAAVLKLRGGAPSGYSSDLVNDLKGTKSYFSAGDDSDNNGGVVYINEAVPSALPTHHDEKTASNKTVTSNERKKLQPKSLKLKFSHLKTVNIEKDPTTIDEMQFPNMSTTRLPGPAHLKTKELERRYSFTETGTEASSEDDTDSTTESSSDADADADDKSDDAVTNLAKLKVALNENRPPTKKKGAAALALLELSNIPRNHRAKKQHRKTQKKTFAAENKAAAEYGKEYDVLTKKQILKLSDGHLKALETEVTAFTHDLMAKLERARLLPKQEKDKEVREVEFAMINVQSTIDAIAEAKGFRLPAVVSEKEVLERKKARKARVVEHEAPTGPEVPMTAEMVEELRALYAQTTAARKELGL